MNFIPCYAYYGLLTDKLNRIMNKNKNKYYKVKETKNALGETEFLVFACDNWIEKFFGAWSEYRKQNKTLEEAKDQINTLVSWKIIKEKIVYKKKVQ